MGPVVSNKVPVQDAEEDVGVAELVGLLHVVRTFFLMLFVSAGHK